MTQFTLTETEETDWKEFQKEHIHKDVNKGTIGGGISISFHPNAIGRGVTCKCEICGEEKNITDYCIW